MSRRERQRRRRRHRGHPLRRVVMFGVVGTFAALTIGALGIVGWVASVADSAQNIDQLKPRDPGQTSEVFAADGTPLGYIQSDILRTYVHNNQIPKLLKEATVAIEDRRFYKRSEEHTSELQSRQYL